MNYIQNLIFIININKTSTFVNARLEEYFPDCSKFKPERFLNENKADGFDFNLNSR